MTEVPPTSLMMSAALWNLCMSVHWDVLVSASAMLRSTSFRNLQQHITQPQTITHLFELHGSCLRVKNANCMATDTFGTSSWLRATPTN